MMKILWTVGALAIASVVGLASVPAANAKDGDVRVAGKCTSASKSKLKLSEENGKIEVEFEVDQNRNGVRWAVVLRQNGQVIRKTTRVTRAPSGSFSLRSIAANGAGADRFTATAARRGETCSAKASF